MSDLQAALKHALTLGLTHVLLPEPVPIRVLLARRPDGGTHAKSRQLRDRFYGLIKPPGGKWHVSTLKGNSQYSLWNTLYLFDFVTSKPQKKATPKKVLTWHQRIVQDDD